jgi:hypothetical protein
MPARALIANRATGEVVFRLDPDREIVLRLDWPAVVTLADAWREDVDAMRAKEGKAAAVLCAARALSAARTLGRALLETLHVGVFRELRLGRAHQLQGEVRPLFSLI